MSVINRSGFGRRMLLRMADPLQPVVPELPPLTADHPCALCHIRGWCACALLGGQLLLQLRSGGRDLLVPAGHSLYRQGEPADALFMLRTGLMRLVSRDADGREQVLAFQRPGEIIGLTLRQRHGHGVEAVLPSKVCRWPRPSAQALAACHPVLAGAMLSRALEALDHAQDQALCLGQRSATSRLAWFLLQLGGGEPAHTELRLPMTRSDIAAHLGLNKESVSRSFTQLRKTRVVALPRPGCVRVLRPDALRSIASCSYRGRPLPVEAGR